MNKIFIPGILIVLLISACKHHETPAKKIYLRNTLITPKNAYNNLFLDSAKLEDFIVKQAVDENDADVLRTFYYGRNFEFAWFSKYSVTEQGRHFWNLASYNIKSLKEDVPFSKTLLKRMPDITAEDSLWIGKKDTLYTNTELMLSTAFIHSLHKYTPAAGTLTMAKYLPAQKKLVMEAARQVIDSSDAGLNEDAQNAYSALKRVLKKFYSAAENGGWQKIPYISGRVKKGVSSPVIPLIKNRLHLTGEYVSTDTSEVYDTLLYDAVKKAQATFGYNTDGVITDSLIKDLNVPAHARVQQLLVNLNRVSWMPTAFNSRFITANIPEYKLHVYNGKTKAFDMDVVVGKQGSATVIFTGNLNQIVFSPYWNIPPSIIKKEILSKIADDSGYLARQNMEITGYKNGLPIVRQLPGGSNSLGRVKFLFNNSYNIYFHDTPAKDLFSRRKRAYSHGCIRLSDPVKMATYLLDSNKEWTAEKITEAMNSPKEIYATLNHAVPVIITYYTAWVDETGNLNLRDDIYGHDAAAAEKMFAGE